MKHNSHTKEKGEKRFLYTKPPGRLSLLVCSATLSFLPLMFFKTEGLGSLTVRGYFAAGAILFALFTYYIFLRRTRSPRRTARQNQYRVCLKCYYPLHGLAEVGKCPECGVAFDIDITERIWEREIKPWRFWLRKRPACLLYERLAFWLFVGIPTSVLLFIFVVLVVWIKTGGSQDPGSLSDRLLGGIELIIYGTIVPTLVAALTWLTIRRRKKELAIKNNFLLCTSCRAPLESQEDEGTCPNCETNFKATEIKKLWRAEYYVYL